MSRERAGVLTPLYTLRDREGLFIEMGGKEDSTH